MQFRKYLINNFLFFWDIYAARVCVVLYKLISWLASIIMMKRKKKEINEQKKNPNKLLLLYFRSFSNSCWAINQMKHLLWFVFSSFFFSYFSFADSSSRWWNTVYNMSSRNHSGSVQAKVPRHTGTIFAARIWLGDRSNGVQFNRNVNYILRSWRILTVNIYKIY